MKIFESQKLLIVLTWWVIKHCPVLNKYLQDFEKHFEGWKQYKRTIQTCGAIIMDPDLKYVSLMERCSLSMKI